MITHFGQPLVAALTCMCVGVTAGAEPGTAGGIEVLEGFTVELVLDGLTYPTSVEFDGDGGIFIGESGYSYGDPVAPARVLRLSRDGDIRIVASDFQAPLNDLLRHDDHLLIADRGRVLRLDPIDGSRKVLVQGLPSDGDHHNNQMSIGPDGLIYFGQGTATNSGVVGLDNYKMGWLPQHPEFHDQPAYPIALRDRSYKTPNPLTLKEPGTVSTAPFHPFGKAAHDIVKAISKPSGVIYRMPPDGGKLEVMAWGLRNPYGFVWDEAGRAFITENGFDVRGSRPIANDREDLYRFVEGGWYGWPDYGSGDPVTDGRFVPPDGDAPQFLMAEHPPVQQPLMTFPPHSAICKMAAVDGDGPEALRGSLLIAFWGHLTPMTGEVQEHGGHRVLAIDPEAGTSRILLRGSHGHGGQSMNDGEHGQGAGNGHHEQENQPSPDKHHGSGDEGSPGLERPIDVLVAPDGNAIYVVDFGRVHVSKEGGVRPVPGSGKLWRVMPNGVQHAGPPSGLRLRLAAEAGHVEKSSNRKEHQHDRDE